MLTLPIPIFVALLLGFFFLRMWVTDRRLSPLAWLLACCAMQSVIISLTQYYQVPGMRVVQPVTATLIPVAAWMAFLTTAVRRARLYDMVHLAGPVCAIIVVIAVPMLLDGLIPALFLGYGAAILLHSRRGSDALPQLRLETGELPARIWLIVSLSLMASALSDVLISVAHSQDATWLQPWLISGFSVANLMLIGALVLTDSLRSYLIESEDIPPDTSKKDQAAMQKLQRLMETGHPYLDPDLTLIKLSRKIGIPAKQLSAAINRTAGQNVSRYINDARIKTAQKRLLAGDTVTVAMLSSGFNTKSNFNREFLRVAGMSPSEWMQTEKRTAPSTS